MYCSGVHIPSDIYCTDAYPENLHFPESLFKLQSSCKESQTNTVLPVSLTRASDSKGSASGGGVSVSMESTGTSWGDVFSVLGICSSEGIVAAMSSGGGVCISGSKLKDGWSCVPLTDPGGSDTGVMGWVTWENKLCQFTANLKYKVSKSDTECSMPKYHAKSWNRSYIVLFLPFQSTGEAFCFSSSWRKSDHTLQSTQSASCLVFLFAYALKNICKKILAF